VDNVAGQWHVPAPNPFLQTISEPPRAGLIRGQTSAHRGLRTFAQDRSRGRRERSPMQFSQALPDTSPEGAIYLRWQLPALAPLDFQLRLDRQLSDLREDARQAGVDIALEPSGEQWLLKLLGLQAPMPLVLEHLLTKLGQPLPPGPARDDAPLIPIRQLLCELPNHCQQTPRPSAQPLPDSDQGAWANAHWDGLAVGLSAATQAALGPVLARVPGIAREESPTTSVPAPMRRWHSLQTQGDEQAVLLFCPTPTQDLADEAAWRLLAHLCQAPYYQRLRVELQLGYAVFSGLKQIDGRTGLLLGAQSPGASAAQLVEHMEQFLGNLPELIERIDDSTLASQRQALANQLQSAVLSVAQAAEMLWQAKLAGRPSDYLMQLPDAIAGIMHRRLLDAARRLAEAHGGRYCLSNATYPGMPWQAGH
jgi:coenzyme PQQ biosynthesis probable peptidase PqqF